MKKIIALMVLAFLAAPPAFASAADCGCKQCDCVGCKCSD